MSRFKSPFVIHAHNPAQQRRARVVLGVLWLLSLVVVALLAGAYFSRAPSTAPSPRELSLRADNEALKSRVAVLERSEQVARTALSDVQQTLRERDEEVDGLRADLAFYARLVGGGKREGLAVHSFRATPVADSTAWNFTATLTQNFKRNQVVKGRLTLVVEGIVDGKLTTLDWPMLSQEQDKSGIEYGFKYFQQVTGTIMFSEGFSPNRVWVRTEGDGGRVEQEFSWKDATKSEENGDVSQ